MMVVKFKKDWVFGGFYPGEYELNTLFLTKKTVDKMVDGRFYLSFKVGKKRILVKGLIRTELEEYFNGIGHYTGYGIRTFFKPSNLEKFKSLVGV